MVGFFFVCFVVCLFLDSVSLCKSSGCPRTHFVDQISLELRDLPTSASLVLALKVCATTALLAVVLITEPFLHVLQLEFKIFITILEYNLMLYCQLN